jgi:hypothetical protein
MLPAIPIVSHVGTGRAGGICADGFTLARRSSQINASVSAGIRVGEVSGRRERSASPGNPPASYRANHEYSDCREAPASRATCATGTPSSTLNTARCLCATCQPVSAEPRPS